MRDISARQRQVFQLLADGKGQKQVAAELRISSSAVKAHVRTAKIIVGGKTSTQVVAKLVRRGDIE
jgi:DNA-binding CsgD family transcriptional regulator